MTSVIHPLAAGAVSATMVVAMAMSACGPPRGPGPTGMAAMAPRTGGDGTGATYGSDWYGGVGYSGAGYGGAGYGGAAYGDWLAGTWAYGGEYALGHAGVGYGGDGYGGATYGDGDGGLGLGSSRDAKTFDACRADADCAVVFAGTGCYPSDPRAIATTQRAAFQRTLPRKQACGIGGRDYQQQVQAIHARYGVQCAASQCRVVDHGARTTP